MICGRFTHIVWNEIEKVAHVAAVATTAVLTQATEASSAILSVIQGSAADKVCNFKVHVIRASLVRVVRLSLFGILCLDQDVTVDHQVEDRNKQTSQDHIAQFAVSTQTTKSTSAQGILLTLTTTHPRKGVPSRTKLCPVDQGRFVQKIRQMPAPSAARRR